MLLDKKMLVDIFGEKRVSNDDETLINYAEDQSFAPRRRPDFVVYALYTPYPDAPIFDEGVELGLWDKDCWKNFMLNPKEEYDLPTVWEQFLSKKEMLELFKVLHRRFYFSPKVLLRTLTSLETFEDFKRIFRGGMTLFKLEFIKAHERRI